MSLELRHISGNTKDDPCNIFGNTTKAWAVYYSSLQYVAIQCVVCHGSHPVDLNYAQQQQLIYCKYSENLTGRTRVTYMTERLV